MTTDEKLGLERFRVAVTTKQNLPVLIFQMHRAEIILHVNRVLLKHVIAIFNQSLYHRPLRKIGVFLDAKITQTTCRAKHRFYC